MQGGLLTLPGLSHWPETEVDSSDVDSRAHWARTSRNAIRGYVRWPRLLGWPELSTSYADSKPENATIPRREGRMRVDVPPNLRLMARSTLARDGADLTRRIRC